MRELLKRWAKAEPERCGLRGSFALVKLSGTEHSLLSTGLLSSESAVVLAAVIEAIEANTGEWVLRSGNGTWVAAVSLQSGENYWNGIKDGRDSAVHALLAAYVAALEAEGEEQK